MIKVGYIATTYGHKGELKVMPLTNNPLELKKIKDAYILRDHNYEKVHITSLRYHKNFLIMSFEEIIDMNTAEKFRDTYLYLPEEQLTPLPEDHFYIFKLLGLAVYQDQLFLGKIKDIIQTGSNDVFIVENEGKEILIPALKSVVQAIDLDSGLIKVQLPEGLLD